jgi:D-arabinose 1-dehydrogenase-like Zn-dependent alcohol dehydrogenase
MGFPAGSRRDLHGALALAGVHHLRPNITRFALEDAERVVAEMLAVT